MKFVMALGATVFLLIGCSTSQDSFTPPTSLSPLTHDNQTYSFIEVATDAADYQVADAAILHVGNYRAVLSNVLGLNTTANATKVAAKNQTLITTDQNGLKQLGTKETLTQQQPMADIDLHSLLIKDSLVFENIAQGASDEYARGEMKIEAPDGSYIKINANTGNAATFMTTVVTDTLIVSFEQPWSDLSAGTSPAI